MKRNILVIAGVVVLIVVLAAGAFVAADLLAEQKQKADLPPGALVFEDVMDDGSGNPVTVKTVILPAEELPERPSEASGVFKRQEDNSYFVGTGNISISVNEVNGETTTAVEHSGPEIEVVTGRDTQFYRDVTQIEYASTESKEQTLQQTLALMEQPQEMPEGAEIQAWGQKSGDRVIADVVVFSDPR
jgi:hypothetical protein